jgi:hypothetical protein
MSTAGPIDAISEEALEIIKEFKAKYSEKEIEEMMKLGYLPQNLLSKEDTLRMVQFSKDFGKYIHAIKAIKAPQQEVADNRSIEERFPEFVATLTYRAPKPNQQDLDEQSDSDDEITATQSRRKSTPW